MKKLLLLMSLVSIGFTNAQTKNKGTFEITPKIGYSSFIEHNENNSNDNNSGSVARGSDYENMTSLIMNRTNITPPPY